MALLQQYSMDDVRVRESLDTGFKRFQDYFRVQESLPFTDGDSSVGMEYELQVAVEGNHKDVDLPIVIRESSYFKNIVKRTGRGDLPDSCLKRHQELLFKNESNIWENSWVRLAPRELCVDTRKMLGRDLLRDKSNPNSKKRTDIERFRCYHRGERLLRIPVSYLLKLALADAMGGGSDLPAPLRETGSRLLDHFLSDNTSPEILSFTVPKSSCGRVGELAANETARTLLFSQLLVQYANSAFGLTDSGQKCLLYCAPHAPARQKQLNEAVPDGFYRQLFISPCLSGWDRGEEKHKYMELCHKTLSRSQLNTIGKLKDAGIIANNLIVLPNTSNTCLANNGTHVSLGSRCLTELGRQHSDVFSPDVEKYYGDLVIKIVEHFLPLFVNSYTAAPYKVDFGDFHPEKVLGFLPHELDYTHLRMIWRRWRKKADLSFMGRTVTPFGPRWLDNLLARALFLRGDIVPDFRLIDYLVTLLSTDSSPALNGIMGNQERLKSELGDMGVFDPSMSIYLLYRQRMVGSAGYAGFEGRSYSLFQNLKSDMADAVDMQNLITALATKYILSGRIGHNDIPDRPSVESERRQIFFCTAIGLPTFYVKKNSTNRFLKKILAGVAQQRNSRRYKGYIRVTVDDYRRSLIKTIAADGADLIENLGMKEQLNSLAIRLADPSKSASEKLVSEALQQKGGSKNGLKLGADELNSAMENYYRTVLKKEYLSEALDVLMSDCRRLEREEDASLKEVMALAGSGLNVQQFIARYRKDIVEESASPSVINTMIGLGLAAIHRAERESS